MKFRIAGLAAIIAVLFLVGFVLKPKLTSEPLGIDTPSPALGKIIATAVHQTLSDPFFAPLEKLTTFLDRHPGMEAVSVDLLTKWAPDDDIPTCFVWNTDGSRLQLDHETDPDVIDGVLKLLREGVMKANPNQLLYLKYLKIKGEKFWVGFIRIPLGTSDPTQMAGAIFSLDRYIERDVPRLLSEMLDRPRFPLANFQTDSKLLGDPVGSHLSMRILRDDGEVYFQRGRNFDPATMIYAESQFFPKPIVAMMEGWDLQVFSINVVAPKSDNSTIRYWGIYGITAFLVSLLWWIGTKPKYPHVPTQTAITNPKNKPVRKIRLDETNNIEDE